MLSEIGATFIHRDLFSPSDTGFVFAGFGSSELFPTILAFQADGIIADRLKKRPGKRVMIDRVKVVADIVPFAQREMVDRFLFGIDPGFEDAIPQYLEDALRKTGLSIIEERRPQKNVRDELKKKLERSIDVTLREFKTTAVAAIKDQYERDIRGIVSFMPKQELANFAESLVNITSIKRRVSAEQETVGGPIDVAVISRSDGFVWVKRKHYFDPNLNPRYFFRKYGMMMPTGNGAQS